MQNHLRPPFRGRIMKEIDEDAIQGPEARRKTPPAQFLQRISVVFDPAEATAAGTLLRIRLNLFFPNAGYGLSSRETRERRKQEGCIVELEYKLAEEVGYERHALYDAIFAAEGHLIL